MGLHQPVEVVDVDEHEDAVKMHQDLLAHPDNVERRELRESALDMFDYHVTTGMCLQLIRTHMCRVGTTLCGYRCLSELHSAFPP